MTILWIIGIVVAFVIGIYVGAKLVAAKLEVDLKNPESIVAKTLSGALDHCDNLTVDQAARAAEMYQETTHCLNNCGAGIAKMIRATMKTPIKPPRYVVGGESTTPPENPS